MKKLSVATILTVTFAVPIFSQQARTTDFPARYQAGPPTDACPGPGTLDLDLIAHQIYSCSVAGGAWFVSSGAGGTGNVSAYTIVSFSATPTFAVASNTSDTFKITLTGNVTASALVGPVNGEPLTFEVCQDVFGGHTFVPPTGFAQFDAISLTPLACTKQVGFWDGSNFIAKARSVSDEPQFVQPCPTRSQPSAPLSGLKFWCDSTTNLLEAINSSGGISRTLTPAGGANSLQTYDGATNLSGNASDTLDGSGNESIRGGLTTGSAGSTPGTWTPTPTIVANLSTTPPAISAGSIREVSDGISTSDCTVGGSNHTAVCKYNGATWESVTGLGASPGGVATELQFRGGPSTFSAWTNSSIPFAGELNVSTTPTPSASRSVIGLGAAPAGCPTGANAGCYLSINAASTFVGDWLHYELNGANVARIYERFAGVPTLTLGVGSTPTDPGFNLQNSGSHQAAITDPGGGDNINFLIGGSGRINFTGAGKMVTYNTIPTAGLGLTPVYAAIHSTAQTAAIGTSTLCAAGTCAGGLYIVKAELLSTVTCATPGPAVVAVTLTWTDEAGTKTAQVIPLDVNFATSLSANLALGTTTGQAFGKVVIRSTGTNPIQYATTYTACTSGTGTYNLDLTVVQDQ
jgi:hypothetical protein